MNEKQAVLPFETKRGFSALPNAVCDLYVRHPKFTPTTERLYRYLLRRHNAEYGYAWPSWSAIMKATNIGSKDTVTKSLDSLEYLGLIKRFKNEKEGGYDNNMYVFYPPIEDEDEFCRKFGDELAKKYRRNNAAAKDVDAIGEEYNEELADDSALDSLISLM